MKKIMISIVSALMLFGILAPNIVSAETYQTKDYNKNVELASSLGLDLTNVADRSPSQAGSLLETPTFKRISDGKSNNASIIATDLKAEETINLFDPLVMYFDVSSGIEITKCTWYLEGPAFTDPHPLKGTSTDTNLLVIPSVAFKYDDEFYVEVEIEYIDHNNGDTTGKAFTSTEHVIINTTITQKPGQVINIGNFTISPGKIFSLETYNIGKGWILFDENGKDVTLENVEFSYDPETLYIDRILTMNEGFYYYSFQNEFSDINFNLVGNNVLVDKFHHPNSDEDGAAFCSSTNGSGTSFVMNPNIHINGPGSLKTSGGQYGMLLYGTAIIDTTIDISSSKDSTPGRLGNGIFSVGAEFGKNAKINMDIAGKGIDASLAIDATLGNIKINEGAEINIKNTSYIRHPWEYMFIPSKIYGFVFTNEFEANGAKIDIDLIADAKYFSDYIEKYPESGLQGVNPYFADGIHAEYKEQASTLTNINNSEINISASVINCKEDDGFELVRAYGIDTTNTYSKTFHNYDPSTLNINNSKINIDINDDHIDTAIGIRGNSIKFDKSDILINTKGTSNSFGIVSENINNNFKEGFVVESNDSNININAQKTNENGEAYGAYVSKIVFNYADENKQFNASGTDGALLSPLGEGAEERLNEDNYVPQNITLAKDNEESNKLPINVYSLTSKIKPINATYKGPASKEIQKEIDLLTPAIYMADSNIEDVYRNLTESNNEKVDENDLLLLAAPTYTYYETFLKDNKPATQATIRKIRIPVRPVPQTGTK